jgi:3',5'-cyclic AMP phosphodiesterase CpdA
MKTIAHLSDLHFGKEDPPVVEGLVRELEAKRPSLVAVSGDLTQRARAGQFRAARAFLDRMPAPIVVVPGNHDIPLFNVVARWLAPLGGYTRHIHADPEPFFHDEALAVMGVNTARPGKWSDGRLSEQQIERIREHFCPIPERVFKVIVTHHPFIPSPGDRAHALVERGFQALQAAEQCGVDLLLAGHLHMGFTGDVRPHYLSIRRSMLVAQAGTSTSHRRRGEPNTYNWIVVDPPRLSIEQRGWDVDAFVTRAVTRYVKREDEWMSA